ATISAGLSTSNNTGTARFSCPTISSARFTGYGTTASRKSPIERGQLPHPQGLSFFGGPVWGIYAVWSAAAGQSSGPCCIPSHLFCSPRPGGGARRCEGGTTEGRSLRRLPRPRRTGENRRGAKSCRADRGLPDRASNGVQDWRAPERNDVSRRPESFAD